MENPALRGGLCRNLLPEVEIMPSSPAILIKASHGTPSLLNFFSPASGGSKRKVDEGGQPNVPHNKIRRGIRGNGSASSPLQLLSSETCVTDLRKSMDNEVECLKVKRTPQRAVDAVGLVRICSSDRCPQYLSVPKGSAKTLFVGAILGRNLSSTPSKVRASKRNNKVDLGINNAATGVSRKHLHVTSVDLMHGTVTIEQFSNATNMVGVYRYIPASRRMASHAKCMLAGESLTLAAGDVIEFDYYNRAITPFKRPEQVFRVVTIRSEPQNEVSIIDVTGGRSKGPCLEPQRQKAQPTTLPSVTLPGAPIIQAKSCGVDDELPLARDETLITRPKVEDPLALDSHEGDSSFLQGPANHKEAVDASNAIIANEIPSSNDKDLGALNVTKLTTPLLVAPSEKSSDKVDLQSHGPATVKDEPVPDPSMDGEIGLSLETEKAYAALNAEPQVKEESCGSDSQDHDTDKLSALPVLEDGCCDTATSNIDSQMTFSNDGVAEQSVPPPDEISDTLSRHESTTVCNEVCNKNTQLDICASTKISQRTQVSPSDSQRESDVGVSDEKGMVDDLSGYVPITRKPWIPNRFRVEFDVVDLFGCRRTSWFFGTAVKISTKPRKEKQESDEKYVIDVRFDDGTTVQVEYPGKGVERLVTCATKSKYFVELSHPDCKTIKRRLAYDSCPQELAVGDLVDCHYQDGISNDAFFRGRIAAVDPESKTCEVAYDDGEYECCIPMSNGNFSLVERGIDNLVWLEEQSLMEVSLLESEHSGTRPKRQRGRRSGKALKSPQATADATLNHSDVLQQQIMFKVKHSNGNMESKSYKELVSELFASVRESRRINGKIKTWPKAALKVETCKKEKIVSSAILESKAIKKIADESNTSEYSRSITSNAHDLSVAEDNAVAVVCSFQSDDEDGDNCPQLPLKEIHPSLCNSIFRALNSAEPHLGVDLSTQMSSFHNNVPRAALTSNLFDMMKNGPKSEGTMYPDPNKLELASHYLASLASNRAMMESLNKVGPSTWSQFESYLLPVRDLIYRVAGDDSSTKLSSLSRVGNSLQVTACGLEIILILLASQLNGMIRDNAASESGIYRSLPIVRALRDCDGGIREAFKFVARINATAWTRFGHFIATELTGLNTINDPCASHAIQSCTVHAMRCVEALGQITCYTAWLFCAEERKSMHSKDCAFVITDALCSEIDNSPYDLSAFVALNGRKTDLMKYWKKIKLRFVLHLDKQFAASMQSSIAAMMGFSKEWSAIFGKD